MKARPILFSAPMVRALLDGRKTQTRRAFKPQPEVSQNGWISWKDLGDCTMDCFTSAIIEDCPYGVPGDLLWARETLSVSVAPALRYDADNEDCADFDDERAVKIWNRYGHDDGPDIHPTRVPSIFMPRWASRLTLRITEVRVERVHEISLADVRAEGCEVREFWLFGSDSAERQRIGSCVYGALWSEINGRASWVANPWVWALTFEVLNSNVDDVLKAAA